MIFIGSALSMYFFAIELCLFNFYFWQADAYRTVQVQSLIGSRYFGSGMELRILACWAVLVFLNNFQYGYTATYFNTSVDSFKNFLNVSMTKRGFHFDTQTYNWMWNLLINIWSVTQFFGIWLAPFVNDRYGRKGIS